ncbi:unnamed protein product, partial [Tetraodon nigroviridis]
MPTSDGPSHFPVFVAPQHANHPRPPGYVPGRVAPVRLPPPAKAPPPPPVKPHGPPPVHRATFSLSEESRGKERARSLRQRRKTYICVGASTAAFFVTLILILSLRSGDVFDENCPDHNPSLSSWNPGHQPQKAVVIRRGQLFKLETSTTLLSLTIQSGGQVVFADSPDGSKNITLRTHHILIEDGAALHIGAPKCRYRSYATIALMGRSDSTAVLEIPGLGRKFIGVMAGGTLELHGAERVSWTLLTRSVTSLRLIHGPRNFSRGINLRVIDQDTAAVLSCERFDTHDSRNDSQNLTRLLLSLPHGRIVALAVGDSAVKSLLDETKKAIAEKLGSSFVYDLKYRLCPWAGGPSTPAPTCESSTTSSRKTSRPSACPPSHFQPFRREPRPSGVCGQSRWFQEHNVKNTSHSYRGWSGPSYRAPKCRYRSYATIALMGRSDSTAVLEIPGLGRKFIGVMAGGTLELHGAERVSWTLLTRSVSTPAYPRADQDTAAVLSCERFDTHDSRNDSQNLTRLLLSLPHGRIVALAVGDSAVKSLLDETKKAIAEKLGSSFVYDLKYRQAWALVSEVGGGNASCSEDVREHENHDTGGRAVASRNFTTVDGVGFSVTAYSEWKNGFPISGFQVDAVDQVVLNLQDQVHETWKPGDQIVIASTDYSMHQAEEFTLLPCPQCTSRQVRIQGADVQPRKPQYHHVGEIVDGIDMRAEVALLSRNILIYGEMESSCYGKMCQFYSHDTFGGHVKIFRNFSSVHLSHVELKNMGQQSENSRYPVHFHMCGDVDQRGGYWEPTYVDGLSIHHSFSRCLTIHATNGLLVKNTLGYDTLGHCFFLEDGIEQRNTFFHNLGLLTRPGTLLPTDRNETLCTSIRDKVYKGYTPSPSTECKAVSTFWIAHPNNNLISNAAAGSQDAGIWFVFHSSSTGESHGLVPETKAELTPLGIFYNNRAHSNFKAGLFIDKGVKNTNASIADPREYLCLDNSARFRPHQDANSSLPRVAAVIDTLISFKNNDLGAWIRGGDIIIQNSGFADNGVGLSFASSFLLFFSASVTVKHYIFIKFYRKPMETNKYWGLGGVDEKNRTLPRNRTFPIRGFQIYDGPVQLTQSTFRGFMPRLERYTSAVGFNLKNTWQLTPRNNLSHLSFQSTVGLRAFFGRPGQWFEENDLDGDKTSIFHDVDGTVTGYRDTYVGRADNYLIQHPDCINMASWNGVICSGRYSQVYIQTQGAPNRILYINRNEYPSSPLILRGINSQGAPSQQYQPVLMMAKSYTLHWNGPAPKEVVLSLINFDKDDWVLVGLCYPPDGTLQIMADINDRQSNTFDDITDYGPVSSLAELEKKPVERKYFFDEDVGLLWLYLRARHDRDGHSYCSVKGCERVKVLSTTSSKQICNCMAKAYPKYSKVPSAAVPMPAPNTQPCKGCGAKQLVFSSEPWTSHLQTQVKSLCHKEQQRGENSSFINVSKCQADPKAHLCQRPLSVRVLFTCYYPVAYQVNGATTHFSHSGYFVVSVDACSGKITQKKPFARMDAGMEQYLKTGIP